eukprot:scaffold185950_cov18-Tisochrysis_lutea.AAC.1
MTLSNHFVGGAECKDAPSKQPRGFTSASELVPESLLDICCTVPCTGQLTHFLLPLPAKLTHLFPSLSAGWSRPRICRHRQQRQ